ncbi:LysR family transcriptional regulator [Gordonibacter massiliensis (ex Traore et al. 2017)]|uniref:LysR family transcriptional regulator n=1 Tax=Gordonibacter massiliensis (ex Traore et al. 2017) TaxID=1841863 RepID=UPI001C8BE079|nr:LysR family transcriptional regulator [Gordonibacter massiliensis (ex Traore et al. 2017)]MBX9033007.1 LysR family transcriptional regulator [Gordonibacter massiliensis (ex Traore et al. 2017)]
MDIGVFREFAEIVMQGSYSAAAKALNLSQPTLSRHIAALEKELNAELVADVLPVRLTPAGDAVFQAALSMGDLYAGMQDDLAELRRASPERIRIHDTPALGPLLVRLVAAANGTMRAHPRTIVEYVVPRSGKTPREAVAEGLCDLSFVQLVEEVSNERQDDGRENGDGSFFEPPEGVRVTAVSRPGNRLVLGVPQEIAGGTEASLASFRHETFFLLAHRSCEPLKETFVAACRRRGFRPAVRMLPCARPEEFYLMDHGEGVHMLSEDDLAIDASFARRLEERMALVPLADSDGLRLRWHALHRAFDPPGDSAFACFLKLLAEPGGLP